MAEDIFRLSGLVLEKDGSRLLDIPDFSVRTGEFIVCTGPNGAGKTMLIRSLLGFEPDVYESVLLRGSRLRKPLSQSKDRVSYVPQHPENYMLGATVLEDILFSSSKDLMARNDNIIKNLGVSHLLDKPTALLSGGEKKRVSLVSALTSEPEILILDEPFTELDYDGVREMSSLLHNIHEKGTCVFLVTHDISKILAYSSRLICLNTGRISLDILPGQVKPHHSALGFRVPDIPVCECVWK
ncbi:MAG: ABC transporter ATP-binding protein [Spirochaetales bacterium]|nr:ABC transporter ATP-binding protein [Spirochaetales bacterium]